MPVGSLEGTIDVSTTDDGVTFTYTVHNDGSEPVRMEFPNAGMADVAVFDENGSEIWRYSDGRMYAQVITSDEIEPDGHRQYEMTWEDPEAGEFIAAAELRATTETAAVRTEFTV